jgi:hypothetical protein
MKLSYAVALLFSAAAYMLSGGTSMLPATMFSMKSDDSRASDVRRNGIDNNSTMRLNRHNQYEFIADHGYEIPAEYLPDPPVNYITSSDQGICKYVAPMEFKPILSHLARGTPSIREALRVDTISTDEDGNHLHFFVHHPEGSLQKRGSLNSAGDIFSVQAGFRWYFEAPETGTYMIQDIDDHVRYQVVQHEAHSSCPADGTVMGAFGNWLSQLWGHGCQPSAAQSVLDVRTGVLETPEWFAQTQWQDDGDWTWRKEWLTEYSHTITWSAPVHSKNSMYFLQQGQTLVIEANMRSRIAQTENAEFWWFKNEDAYIVGSNDLNNMFRACQITTGIPLRKRDYCNRDGGHMAPKHLWQDQDANGHFGVLFNAHFSYHDHKGGINLYRNADDGTYLYRCWDCDYGNGPEKCYNENGYYTVWRLYYENIMGETEPFLDIPMHGFGPDGMYWYSEFEHHVDDFQYEENYRQDGIEVKARNLDLPLHLNAWFQSGVQNLEDIDDMPIKITTVTLDSNGYVQREVDEAYYIIMRST